MPHPEREHELMIEVARLRVETERLGSACVAWGARVDELNAALAAANARPEKAEKDLRYEANRSDIYAAEVSRLERTHDAAQEALAAARRECEEAKAEAVRLRDVLAHNNAADLRRVIDAEKRPFTQEWVDKMHRSWVDAKQQESWRADRAEAALSVFRDAMARIRDRSNHGDFYEAMKIADATLAALAAPAAGEEGKR